MTVNCNKSIDNGNDNGMIITFDIVVINIVIGLLLTQRKLFFS